MSDPKHEACPDCGKACERVLSAPIVSVRGAEYRAAANKETRQANMARAAAGNMQLRESTLKKYGQVSGHTHNCALAGCHGLIAQSEAKSETNEDTRADALNESEQSSAQEPKARRFGGLPHLVGVDKK